jgi:lysophospholipase L1-like esterase
MAFGEVFDSLVSSGVKNIFRLSQKEIGLDIETTVDGTHPNDIGMMRYADAYEKKIRSVLNEPEGTVSTTIPVTQRRDASIYDWETRHREVLALNKSHPPRMVFIGNSIIHYWAGPPSAPIAHGPISWKSDFEPLDMENMGFGWDRIENVLWRVYHGELDGISPDQILLMIGTNNLEMNSDEEIITGLRFLIKAIEARQPAAHILLMGILPRRDQEARVAALNQQISRIPSGSKIKYADAGKYFLLKNGKINEALFSDGLHPDEAGYEKLGKFILSNLNR